MRDDVPASAGQRKRLLQLVQRLGDENVEARVGQRLDGGVSEAGAYRWIGELGARIAKKESL